MNFRNISVKLQEIKIPRGKIFLMMAENYIPFEIFKEGFEDAYEIAKKNWLLNDF